MPLPDWTTITALPYRPLAEGYDILSLYEPPEEMKTEDGPSLLVNWRHNDWTRLNYRMLFTFTQYETFENFLKTSLNRGESRFTMPAAKFWITDPWPDKTVYIEKGTPTKGPTPRGSDRVTVDFVLVVLGL
jgi:hypothetical protein